MPATQSILARLIGKIESAPIDSQPTENIYIEELFEHSLYKEMLQRLPPREVYDPIVHSDAHLPDGRVTRGILDLTDESLGRFPAENRDFWQNLNKVFASDTLQKCILSKFRITMRERFGDTLPEMTSVAVFYKDYPGYFIRPHQDVDWKVSTFQMYLPADESQIHLGTSFHLKKGEGFDLHKTNAFKPNSGYSFARTENSWHSVSQIGANESERNTLALTIYLKGREYRSGAAS